MNEGFSRCKNESSSWISIGNTVADSLGLTTNLFCALCDSHRGTGASLTKVVRNLPSSANYACFLTRRWTFRPPV